MTHSLQIAGTSLLARPSTLLGRELPEKRRPTEVSAYNNLQPNAVGRQEILSTTLLLEISDAARARLLRARSTGVGTR